MGAGARPPRATRTPAAAPAPRIPKGKTISDAPLRQKLQVVANLFKADLRITSGDRNYVPKGGSKTSLHLQHRAADFHVQGITDGAAFRKLKESGKLARGYEVIWHQATTNTGGPHLHLGRYADNRKSKFMTEARGKYTQIP